MGIFDAGRSILESVASEASEQVVFAPVGSEPSVELPARVGQRLFKVASGGVPVTVATQRFIVRTADLPRLPANGDAIHFRGRRYKCGHPDGGPPWRWHGSDHATIAIYATDFGAVPVQP